MTDNKSHHITEKELFERQQAGYRYVEELRVRDLRNRNHEEWVRTLDFLWSVREPDQDNFFSAAEEVQQRLDAAGLRSAFIGGVALQHWGEQRFTKDFDLIVSCPLGAEADVLEKLLTVLQSRDPDPEPLARISRMFLGWWRDGTQVDISLGASGFEMALMDRAVDVDFGRGRTLRCCSSEDLLITKTIAGRNRDWGDIERIVQRSGPDMDWDRVYADLEPLLELAGQPENADRLGEIVEREMG